MLYINTRAPGMDYNWIYFRKLLSNKSKRFYKWWVILLTSVSVNVCIQFLLQSGLPQAPCSDPEPDPWAGNCGRKKLPFNRMKSLSRTIAWHIWPVRPAFQIQLLFCFFWCATKCRTSEKKLNIMQLLQESKWGKINMFSVIVWTH